MNEKELGPFSAEGEKENAINVLESAAEAIKNRDVIKLKELSNRTIHTASTEQDTDSITIAVLIYSLSKIIERQTQYDSGESDKFCNFSERQIERAVSALKSNDKDLLKNSIQAIMDSLKKFSPNMKKNVDDIFAKAKINKASRIYEHGISMEQTAHLLGITMYDLASYEGQKTDKNEQLFKTSPVRDRIKLAMNFFG